MGTLRIDAVNNDLSKEYTAPPGRDPSIDVLKGVAILAVVYAHTAPFCRNFLHLFALTVFLVCSGYCFKNKIACWADWRRYMKGKLRTLYLPCAVCNGIYVLLGGVFLRLGLYTDDPAFLRMTDGWPVPQKLYTLQGIGDILKKFLRVILMTDTTQMGTATWFLIMLFAISAFHGAVCVLTAKRDRRTKQAVLAGLFLLMAALAQFAKLPYGAWMYPRCFFYSYLAYLVGIGIRELDWKFLESPLCALAAVAVLLLLSRRYFVDLANAEIDGVLPYLAGVLSGWCMMKSLADLIIRRELPTRVFSYLGRHTIPIICLHVLCFKPVTWLFLQVRRLPAIYLASFHVDFDAPEPWKFLYFAAGAVLSLVLDACWRCLRKRLNREKSLV